MIVSTEEPDVVEFKSWVPEKPAWRKLPTNLGMRAAGTLAVFLNRLLGSRADGKFGILMYHRVAPRIAGLPTPLHNVEPYRFEQQLRELIALGFQFIPLRQVLSAARRGEALPPKFVVVTFDDGFATVYTRAWPILRDLQIPATIFINTAYIDSDEPFPFDAWGVAQQGQAPLEAYRPLQTAECLEMAASGLIEIGAHTHTHQDHRGRPSAFRKDLQTSVEIVREKFGDSEVTFAFPYGSVHQGFADDEAVRAARTTGVSCGLTTTAALVDPAESPFRWGRFNAFEWDTGLTLAAKLSGWYGWAPRARQALARTFGMKSSSCLMGPILDATLSEGFLL